VRDPTTDTEALNRFFAPYTGSGLLSSLVAGLRDARGDTGRNPDSGRVENPDPIVVGHWPGSLAYLTLMDLVGEAFRPLGRRRVKPSNTPGIIKALRYFTKCTPRDIDAIYALRNSFAHDYSLLRKHPRDPTRYFHFRLTAEPNSPLVRHASRRWSGDYRQPLRRSTATTINLWALGNLVEIVVGELARTGRLSIELAGGSHELLRRYTLNPDA
jgi:hypothetical protein